MEIMQLNTGNVVKFSTPLADEDPNQIFVVLEVMDATPPRAQIKALNTGLVLPPVNTVLVEELEQVEVQTADLIGYHVTIETLEVGKVEGTVIQAKDDMVLLELTKTDHGVKSNVVLTIKAEDGNEYSGTLFVN